METCTMPSTDASVAGIGHSGDGFNMYQSIHSLNPGDLNECYSQEHFHLPKRHYSRPGSPTGSMPSSCTTSRRRRSRRFSGSIVRSRHTWASKELTAQAEGEFFALMELMTNISRRSASLKEVWTKLISERESCIVDMERMYDQLEEYTETISRKEREQHHHHHEHEERKKETSKLRLEITAAIASVSEYKKKLTERDNELDDARREFHEYKETVTRIFEEHEEVKRTLADTQLRLVASEEECNYARKDAEKHHGDLRGLNQKHAELHRSYTDLTVKHEITQKELASLKQSLSVFRKEKHEWLHEKGEFEENIRKCNHKFDEVSRKAEEMSEKYEKKVRETQKLKESMSTIESEREELVQRVEELKRKLDEKQGRWEGAEDRCGKWKMKWEHCEREMASTREEIRLIEIEKTELHEALTKTREEIRLLVIEKERLDEDYHQVCKTSEEHHHKVIFLQESLCRVESTLKEKTNTVHTLTERTKRIEGEREESRRKCADLNLEVERLQASIVSLNTEIITISEKHDGACEKLRECEARYEEVCESVTEYEGGHGELEYEVSTLRTMLREAREQKEKAISARSSADHERDQAVVRYEEKCRELERYEEAVSHQLHARGKSEGRRIVTRTYHKVGNHEGTGSSCFTDEM